LSPGSTTPILEDRDADIILLEGETPSKASASITPQTALSQSTNLSQVIFQSWIPKPFHLTLLKVLFLDD